MAENHRTRLENPSKSLDFRSRITRPWKYLKSVFGPWKLLIFVERNRNILTLVSFKESIKFFKCLQNVWLKLFPVPLGTLAHVHWTTHARWISGLHARAFKLSLSGVFANAGVYAQHKHFAWLEVNSYKAKSLKFQSRILESPCKVLNKHVYELWFYLKTNSAINWD